MSESYAMTELALARRLTAEFGERGMSKDQVSAKFHRSRCNIPFDTFTQIYSGKRTRYSCGSVAHWFSKFCASGIDL